MRDMSREEEINHQSSADKATEQDVYSYFGFFGFWFIFLVWELLLL